MPHLRIFLKRLQCKGSCSAFMDVGWHCFSLELGLCSTSSRFVPASSFDVNDAIANGDFKDVLLSLEAANAATENPVTIAHDSTILQFLRFCDLDIDKEVALSYKCLKKLVTAMIEYSTGAVLNSYGPPQFSVALRTLYAYIASLPLLFASYRCTEHENMYHYGLLHCWYLLS